MKIFDISANPSLERTIFGGIMEGSKEYASTKSELINPGEHPDIRVGVKSARKLRMDAD